MALLSTEDRLTNAEAGLLVATTKCLLAMHDYWTIDEFKDYLAQGRFNEALNLAVGVMAECIEAYVDTYTTSAREAAQFIRDELGVDFWFDLVDPETVSELQQQRDQLLLYYRQELFAAASLALSAAGLAGDSADDVARRVTLSFGLTLRQQQAVENYRRLLERVAEGDAEALTRELRDPQFDDRVRAAARDRTPLTREQIDRMVAAYAERQLLYRAKMSATFEALRSVHTGAENAFAQAIRGGLLTSAQVEREWNSRMDGKERTSHHLLHGVLRVIGETFPGLAGPIRFPGDPRAPRQEVMNCRCWLTYRLMALEQVLVA